MSPPTVLDRPPFRGRLPVAGVRPRPLVAAALGKPRDLVRYALILGGVGLVAAGVAFLSQLVSVAVLAWYACTVVVSESRTADRWQARLFHGGIRLAAGLGYLYLVEEVARYSVWVAVLMAAVLLLPDFRRAGQPALRRA